MLNARNVIAATVALAVVSIVWACALLLVPPQPPGLSADAYGTRPHGHRALSELLGEVGAAVERTSHPPGPPGRPATLVLWGPHQGLVQAEPVHLKRVAQWVREGGRVVVAPERADGGLRSRLDEMRMQQPGAVRRDVLRELGLRGVSLGQVGGPDRAADSLEDGDRPVRESLRRLWEGRAAPVQTAAVRADGNLAWLNGSVAALDVPQRALRVIASSETALAGRLTFTDDEGQEHVLAASFPVEEGEVVVVADAALLQNRLLGRADNAVLAVGLLANPGRAVIFDGFYHGLTIRGNPLWLVSRPPWGLIAILLLAAVGTWIWRQAVFLGPPLAVESPSRRTLAEYTEAMARLFHRGRSRLPFLLRELRSGVLWSLRHRLGLPPGRDDPEEIAAVLARRDPGAAGRLRAAVQAVDALAGLPPAEGSRPRGEAASVPLGGGRPAARIREKDALQALQRISACLSNPSTAPSGTKSTR